MNKNEKKSTKVLISTSIIVLGILLILFGLSRCGHSVGTVKPDGDTKENLEFNENDGKVETGKEVTDEDSIRVAGSDEDMDADNGAFVLPDDEDYFDSEKSGVSSGKLDSNNAEGDKQQAGQQQTDKDKPFDTKPGTEDGDGEDEGATVPTKEIEEKEPEETEQTTTQWGTLY